MIWKYGEQSMNSLAAAWSLNNLTPIPLLSDVAIKFQLFPLYLQQL